MIPFASMIIQVLLGGFIGGITNKIAITMLFERKWHLSGSGVRLKEHHKIVHSLAQTVEVHLVNSKMIQEELRKLLQPVKLEKTESDRQLRHAACLRKDQYQEYGDRQAFRA